MYINYIHIQNIRSLKDVEIPFREMEEPLPGWHVFIGDNGAGKTSFIQAIALALMGPTEAASLRENWSEWLSRGTEKGYIQVHLEAPEMDKDARPIACNLGLSRRMTGHQKSTVLEEWEDKDYLNPHDYNWSAQSGWFSASYGPFRRFRGGDKDKEKIFYSNPKAAAHISAFGEDAALTEVEAWLQKLHYQHLEDNDEATVAITSIIKFLNEGGLLPHGTKLEKITTEGIFFRDANSQRIELNELSDGYRSILSLTLELLRQLQQSHNTTHLFSEINRENFSIHLPGVVMIDEVDAHLHPTWQTRIGQWFTRYFPNIQFIVTTHSPLICRGCTDENGTIKGSIWHLATPGTEENTRQLMGAERDRLVFGNVLNAYGTEAFGAQVERAAHSKGMLQEYAQLDKLNTFGQLPAEKIERYKKLAQIFTTDAISDF